MTLIPQTRMDNAHGAVHVLYEHFLSSCQMRTCLCDHSAGFCESGVAECCRVGEAEDEVSGTGLSD